MNPPSTTDSLIVTSTVRTLIGTTTSRRSHDATDSVVAETLDVYQHQAPTTPGTSGSSIVHCGLVTGINNAGTVKLVASLSRTTDGDFDIVRQAAASNNFGVHVKHIHELIDLFDANAFEGSELPVAAAVVPTPAPATGGGGGGGAEQPASVAGNYVGGVTDPQAQHQFQFTVDAQGNIMGGSLWLQTGNLALTGRVAADGTFQITDNAPERLGFRRGVYQGRLAADGSLVGIYFEQSREELTWQLTGSRQ